MRRSDSDCYHLNQVWCDIFPYPPGPTFLGEDAHQGCMAIFGGLSKKCISARLG